MPRKSRPVSLRLYTFLLIGGVLAAFVIMFFVIFSTTMPDMLLQAENIHLTRQRDVVKDQFDSAMRKMYLLVEDCAIWEPTADFAAGHHSSYMENTWSNKSILQAYQANFIIIKDLAGKDLYSDSLDYRNSQPLALPEGLSAYLSVLAEEVLSKHRLGYVAPNGAELGKRGIIFFHKVPYSVAVLPILPSRDSTTPTGSLIMGNVLDNQYFQDLTSQKSISFSLADEVEDKYLSSDRFDLEREQVYTSVPMLDINGNIVLLRMLEQRTIYSDGKRMLERSQLMLSALLLLFAFLLYRLITQLMLAPIEHVSTDISKREFQGGLVVDKYSKSREFVTLCSSINNMLRRLNQSRISIDVMQRVLNGLDAYIYVSDRATNEILFINDKMKEQYRLDSIDSKKNCWQLLATGQGERCRHCPLDRLEAQPDSTQIWEEYDATNKRYYRNTGCLIPWSDGKTGHLRLKVDITESKAAEGALQQRLEQEKLMSDLSGNFIANEDMTLLIAKALRMVGSFMSLSKIQIVQTDTENDIYEINYEWNDGREAPRNKEAERAVVRQMGVLRDVFVGQGVSHLAFNNITGMEEFAMLQELGIRAFIALPLFVGNKFWGVLLFDDNIKVREWSESEIQLSLLISSTLSAALDKDKTDEALARMSALVESSPQVIFYANPAGEFEYLNPAIQDVLGYSPDDLCGKSIGAIMDEDACRQVMRDIFPAVLRDGKRDFLLPVLRHDGEERMMSFSAFRTGFRKPGVGMITVDITERIRLERENIAAKEQAERSNSAKSEFLSRMSHEMRTPMNAIIGMTNIAKSAADQEKKDFCLEKIDDASTHLLGVINDILDMSKIEANKFELSPSEFAFEKMLMRVMTVINFRVEERDQNLLINVDPKLPYALVGDEQRLAQVITNLLSNAVKFTPEKGSISLNAKLVAETDGLCTIHIEVVDTGIGISPEQQAKLFKSFEQADGSISRRFGGTGLGLAISKRIVELMGGKIWIESELGQGATFAFTIQARRSLKLRKKPLHPGINWSGLKVLAVDDAPDVRDYFSNLAEGIGFPCVTAGNAEEACELLSAANCAFDVIFVDWKMPGMNGIELSAHIRNELCPNAVLILISAGELEEIEAEAKAAGVHSFITKPLFPSVIVNSITEALGFTQQQTDEQETKPATPDNFRGKKILLAEDIDINREIVLALLEPTGLAIDCAENGLRAVELFQQHPGEYHMIFMDIHMPEVDGYEATRRIRALAAPDAQTVPIVAMTANVFREDIERCLNSGMNDHVGKPLNVEDLFSVLQKYLP